MSNILPKSSHARREEKATATATATTTTTIIHKCGEVDKDTILLWTVKAKKHELIMYTKSCGGKIVTVFCVNVLFSDLFSTVYR